MVMIQCTHCPPFILFFLLLLWLGLGVGGLDVELSLSELQYLIDQAMLVSRILINQGVL